jgi:hypothetical protein
MTDEDSALIKRRMDEAAQRYIRSEQSDPFCAGRVKLHMEKGISSLANDEGKPSYYDARAISTEFGIQYIDRVRP